MAVQRPTVLVFQEFASLSANAATPELNCLIAGAAYHIQDFPDDREDIQLPDDYSTKNLSATGVSVAPAGLDVVVTAEPPNNVIGAVLDATSVDVYFGVPRVELAHGVDGTIVVTPTAQATLTSATDFAAAGVLPGDWAILTNNAGTGKQVRKIRTVVTTTLTFTSDVGAVLAAEGDTGIALVNAANTKFRIERELPDSLIASSFVVVTAQEVSISGGVTLDVGGVAKFVSYAEVYVAYRALRQDLADVTSVSSPTAIPGAVGLIDARNPLGVGLFVAMTNSSASIQAFGVTANTLVGFTNMKASLANRKDIYTVVPLIQDISVIAMLKTEFENLADPAYAVLNGVGQKFRIVVGAPTELPTTKIVVDTNVDGDGEQFGAAPAAIGTLTIVAGANFLTSGVLPGDTLVVSTSTGNDGTYTVAHVNSALALEVTPAFPLANNDPTTSIVITRGMATPVALVVVDATTSALDAPFLDLFDANATFVDDGVLPGDTLEMPVNPTQTSFASKVSLVIATVVSNQRVRIVNNGTNSPLVDNEIPHGVSRAATTTVIPTTPTLTYRVTRALDKPGQVIELMSVAQSLSSRRAVICWPDLIDVSGLTDGSITRDPLDPLTHLPAASQPGFYLSCAIGGLLASLPSHQGLTNSSVAAISKLYNANTYFDDQQMTQISNSGWLVFQQDTPSALPFIIHQLTTDVSTLEFSELSMVKNFDFVALFFADIVDDFLGRWNINQETIGFITAAVNAGIENLKLRRKPRIGAPIISGRLTSIAESTVSSDRLETFIEIDFPKPLNTIGLHLVSI